MSSNNYIYVLVFFVVGLLFAVAFTCTPLILSPRSRGKKKTSTYESGEDTLGSAWVQFDVSYYLFALIFLAFDVEVIFLFPVVLTYSIAPLLIDLLKIVIFIGILALALAYAWRKGIFSWK
ncbi:MAG: NADH-quinone oxidoreductase subunit A [Chlamydiae bacterium]|nr:NADH-quinone oxidoreductase subunit A [Chlamydiota bacterium]MBI3265861.1 NADH-quinone oxidoreductase subunit A [Chlamydiota bacterium]